MHDALLAQETERIEELNRKAPYERQRHSLCRVWWQGSPALAQRTTESRADSVGETVAGGGATRDRMAARCLEVVVLYEFVQIYREELEDDAQVRTEVKVVLHLHEACARMGARCMQASLTDVRHARNATGALGRIVLVVLLDM